MPCGSRVGEYLRPKGHCEHRGRLGPRIAVLDYGIGNLRSAEKALQHVGADRAWSPRWATSKRPMPSSCPVSVRSGRAPVHCRDSGLEDPARAAVASGIPFLGVCVGYQLLYDASSESPGVGGLSIFEGTVAPLPASEKHPQMQWNRLEVWGRGDADPPDGPLHGLGHEPWVYFVHSFAPPIGPETVAVCDYGGPVGAVVVRDNIWGAQFHPEKSGRSGLAMLANFVARAA